MRFRQPFRAVPIRPGPLYRRRMRQAKAMTWRRVFLWLLGAGGLGAAVGLGSVLVAPSALDKAWGRLRSGLDAIGDTRAGRPRPGDYWPNCDSARQAGVTPLHVSEPGYRPELDADGDGWACEPYYGR